MSLEHIEVFWMVDIMNAQWKTHEYNGNLVFVSAGHDILQTQSSLSA